MNTLGILKWSFAVAASLTALALPKASFAQAAATTAPAPLSLTSTRSVFTMAEPVEFAVATTPGSNVTLVMTHTDGTVTTVGVPSTRNGGVQIVRIMAGSLKPGDYTATLSGSGADSTASVALHVARTENPNAYWIGAWHQGNPDADTLQTESGWMWYSSDLLNASVRQPKPGDVMDHALAARIRAYSECVMGGGHQMDLQLINDWGDSWVQRSVLWKMSLAALSTRLYPQMGIHAFDEPGLTWWPYPNGDANPFAIPPEVYDFKNATGKDMPLVPINNAFQTYHANPSDFEDFVQYRLKFLPEAWTGSKWAVDLVDPNFTTINQLASAYATGDVADGVNDQMDKSYDVCSGHGGYSDWAGSFGAVLSGESSHGWAWNKPHIYLPMWLTADSTRMRQEAFLPWSIKEEGIMLDPNHDWTLGGSWADVNGLVELSEVNRRMAMVGDMMEKLPRGTQPIAVLQSSRQYAADLIDANYPTIQKEAPYQSQHAAKVKFIAERIMGTGRMPNWIDENEATVKGADFLKQWKIIYCPGLSTATPAFTKAITDYIAAGGKFVQNKDDRLQIPGAVVGNYPFTTDGDPGHDPKSGGLTNDYYWRQWQLQSAPTFSSDLDKWLGPEAYRSNADDNAMLMTVHQAGPATYLMMGNDYQDPNASRSSQNDPVSLDTTIKVPATGGPIYDLLNGGQVPVTAGVAPLHLGPGDAACWVQLPADPGKPVVTAKATGSVIGIDVAWGTAGYLPFQLSIYDPANNLVDQLYRSTSPEAGHTYFHIDYPVGLNAPSGAWTVKVTEWINGASVSAPVPVKLPTSFRLAGLSQSPVSIYFDDASKITNLLAGNAPLPPYDEMSYDLKRVMNFDPKKFAVFGPADAANKIAAALTAKGMDVSVNPDYSIVPFAREDNHGGTGPLQDNWSANFENIYANAIVLPGSDLLQKSWERGHINRPQTSSFPGPGRAYIQWGVGGYQAGYEDVWAMGDIDAATNWILAAISGKPAAADTFSAINAGMTVPAPQQAVLSKTLTVTQDTPVEDTPVGIGSSPDGKVTYVELLGGETIAYDATGKTLWQAKAEMEGGTLAVNPKGDRIAVGGFPGLSVLDAATGKVLGSNNLPAPPDNTSYGASRIVSVAWNDAGDIAAGGWVNQSTVSSSLYVVPKFSLSAVNHDGGTVQLADVPGSVYGVRFQPGSDILLAGADQLTAIDARRNTVLWTNAISGAMAFDFSADGKSAAAGGWGKNAGTFSLTDGSMISSATFDGHIGGVALLPDGTTAVAQWGKLRPLMKMGAVGQKDVLFADKYAFQNLVWSPAWNALVAGEQNGSVWVIGADGKPIAMLADAGSMPRQLMVTTNGVMVGRMNRTVQRITAN